MQRNNYMAKQIYPNYIDRTRFEKYEKKIVNIIRRHDNNQFNVKVNRIYITNSYNHRFEYVPFDASGTVSKYPISIPYDNIVSIQEVDGKMNVRLRLLNNL